MADSMCGPSNALQNFQKHSTLDRTLQQDRLLSRNSHSQGFRSAGLNSGFVEPEFEAFQAGQLPLDHGFQSQRFSHAPPNLQQAGPSGWATDFQQLAISGPGPQIHQQPFNPQLQQRQDVGGWHQDFAQQNQMAGSSVAQTSGVASIPYQYAPMGGMNMTPQYIPGMTNTMADMTQQAQPIEAFDEEAFARAFDEASKSELSTETRQESNQQGLEIGQDILISESTERLISASERPLEQERIGADTIHDPLSSSTSQNEDHNDPDALSRTAARLLDSVQHDQSAKFQNSQFLKLMQQFRDREATVEGDKVVGLTRGAGGAEFSQEEGSALKQEILSVLEKHQGLHWNQGPLSPATARRLFLFLFQIERVTRKYVSRPHLLHEAKFEEVRKKLGDVISPYIMNLYSHRSLATHILAQIATDPSERETEGFKELQKVQDSMIPCPSSLSPKINSEELINQFIEMSKVKREEDVYAAVLGYSMLPGFDDVERVMDINEMRVRHMIKMGIIEAIEECRRVGIFGEHLPAHTVERLGLMWRKGGKGEAFMEAMRKAEKEVRVSREAMEIERLEVLGDEEGGEMRDEADRTIGRRVLGLASHLGMAGTEALYRDAGIEGYSL